MDFDDDESYSFQYEVNNFKSVLDTAFHKYTQVLIRQNKVDFYGKLGSFFEFKEQIQEEKTKIAKDTSVALLLIEVSLQDIGIHHLKTSNLGFWSRVGISSGLVHLCYFIFMIFVRPVARHSFLYRAFKRLY